MIPQIVCSKCGKVGPVHPECWPINITAPLFREGDSTAILDDIQKSMGQYNIDKEYRLCLECYMEGLGIVP